MDKHVAPPKKPEMSGKADRPRTLSSALRENLRRRKARNAAHDSPPGGSESAGEEEEG